MVTVGELTENEILAQIRPLLPIGTNTILGSGDDCAVVSAPGGAFVVTTDVLVEGQHFRTDWSTPQQIGARAVAQNLSDVVSMGAQPTALVTSLVLPSETTMAWLLKFTQGMATEANKVGAGIVGGDLVTGDRLVISVTAHGSYEKAPITRTGAKPGDSVAVAGTLGRSAAGLAALTAGVGVSGRSGIEIPELFSEVVEIYRVPRPPYDAGPLAARSGATAMMDLSDGLSVDSNRLAKASNVCIELDSAGLAPDVAALTPVAQAVGMDPLQWVVFGGEDHSLLATFPADVPVPGPFRSIGRVLPPEPKQPHNVVRLDGREIHGGWDHFRAQM